jgi:hypothetical protein
MIVHRASRAVMTVLLLGGGCLAAKAADIQASRDKLCAFKLEGEIISGDRDRLANLVAHSQRNSLDERTSTLCLKSPGGDYSEGLRISELIYKSVFRPSLQMAQSAFRLARLSSWQAFCRIVKFNPGS